MGMLAITSLLLLFFLQPSHWSKKVPVSGPHFRRALGWLGIKNPAKWLETERVLRALPLFPTEQASSQPLAEGELQGAPSRSRLWGDFWHCKMNKREGTGGSLAGGC